MNGSDQTKERILRRRLEMKARDKGRGHAETWILINRLAGHLESKGDAVGSIELRTRYAAVHLDLADSAVYLSNLAMDWRQVGRPLEAEMLLRQAHEIETRLLSPDAVGRPHRLNNLATVLIMQEKLTEARTLLRQAWELMKGRHDVTSARILVSRLTIGLLEATPPGIHVGRLKTLLRKGKLGAAGMITSTTRAAVVIDYLGNRLSGENAEFLHALYRVINSEEEVDRLGRFRLWGRYPPVPLEWSMPVDSD